MLEGIVEIGKLLAEGFAKSKGEVRTATIHAFMYFAMFIAVYVGAFVIRTDSITSGLKEAYNHSWMSPTQGYTQIHSQETLRKSVNADFVSTKILTQILHLVPNAARVRLSLIHDGVTTITAVDLMRFDITNAVAIPGRMVGEFQINLPLSQWTPDYTPSLLNGQCKFQSVASLQNVGRKARLLELGANYVLGCPVIDVNDQIFGAVLVTWDQGDSVPDEKVIDSLMPQIKLYGRQIGAALDMQRLP